MTTITRVTDDATPAELAEALTHLAAKARREPAVFGTLERPSNWDLRHARIDALLDRLAGR